ncbi:hypothetical protein E8E13_000116 [Curvularia kusanoi]|uniref:Uncharacterized protein n=1 Tax=Curvularia kusanoi TaxID=90978 RepID=A0A9P4W5B9_CURKU|nr:hypothetical protein E8E13_000116 [Curvularia kusanoi]
MSQQDYFSYRPEMLSDESKSTNPTRPSLPERKSSRTMHHIIPPWAEMPATPPNCQSVSFSRWSRFTTSASNTPTGELKASRLCTNRGTSPSYNPPANEWTYLGAEQPFHCGRPDVQRSKHRRQQSAQQSSQQSTGTCPSLSSTASTATNISSSTTEPMDFRRRDVKRASTSSQLTESLATSCKIRQSSLKGSPNKGNRDQPLGMQGLMAKLGVDAADCDGDELPSAFDDSEDEDDEIDMEDLRSAKSAMASKLGGRHGNTGQ